MFQLIFRFILFCKGTPEKLFMRFKLYSLALNFALKPCCFKQVGYKYEVV